MPTDKQYAQRDIVQLDEDGDYYIRHVSAMTAEGLHAKSDIAAELAWRDREIAGLTAQRDEAEKLLAEWNDEKETTIARLREALSRTIHDCESVPYKDGAHRCDFRIKIDAILQRSRAALESGRTDMLASPETIHSLVECRFLHEPSAEFDAFVVLLPATHWARYDLSAVRLGWEAARLLQSSSTETKED